MQRVPEPELMNDAKQAAAYAGSALDNAYWLFVQLFHKYFPGQIENKTILDLGCGPAAIPLRLARHCDTCEIHCVDGAAYMLAEGKKAAQNKGLEERVLFFHGILPDKLPLPRNRYEVVISNSFLHHLADPMILWQAIHEYGLPQASILIIDLLRPTNEEAAQRIVDSYLPDGSTLLRHDMLLSLRAAFTPEEIRAQLRQAGLAEHLTLTMATPFQFAVHGHLHQSHDDKRHA